MRRPVLVLAAVVLLLAGCTAAGAANSTSGSCAAPAKNGTSYTITCTIPEVTVTVPGPTVTDTVTVSPTSAPASSVSSSPASSSTPTTPAPSTTASGPCDPTVAPAAPSVLPAWPSGSNTGPRISTFVNVPAQVSSGPGWSVASNGDLNITGNCVDFSGYRFVGTVNVKGSGDYIHDNDLSDPGGNDWIVYLAAGSLNDTVAYNYFHGPVLSGPTCLNYGVFGDSGADNSAQGSLVLRNHFSMIDHPLQQEQGTVQDNFVEHVCNNGGTGSGETHSDDFFSGGGTLHPLTIEHNWLVNDDQGDGAVSSILLSNAFGAQQHRIVDNNMLGGSSNCAFAFYGGDANSGSSDVRFTNNQFNTANGSAPKGCYYGYATAWNASLSGYVWSGNIWFDGPHAGQTVSAP